MGLGGEGRGRKMGVEGSGDRGRHSGIRCSGPFCGQMAEMCKAMSPQIVNPALNFLRNEIRN